jgi:glycine/D-amino acid oxidase-like deaminating enzyme
VPGTDVVVVGAGIVGASVAYHAACAGAAVLLIDRSVPASGVTGDSFAWVRGPSARAAIDGSTPLRRTALEDWARLERDVPRVLVRWSGSLAWGEEAPSHDDMLGADERLVADELIDALDLEELQGVRPNRFVTAAGTARASSNEPPVS